MLQRIRTHVALGTVVGPFGVQITTPEEIKATESPFPILAAS
jgi:hypothetical protein